MQLRHQTIAVFLNRADVRLACFGLLALIAVYVGFLGTPVPQAEAFIKRIGYYVILLTFVLWCCALWRVARESPHSGLGWSARERVVVGLVALGFTGIAVCQETFHSKILYDEFVLQSTAFNMHFFRDVSTMVRGYDVSGSFLSLDNYLDKRPYFYPFLVSLVHDFSGYRPANAYWLNAGLMPLTLGLTYYLGRSLTGWRGGALAMGLLGSLPLLVQNATGSGMELLNLTMLLATVALALAFFANPTSARLSAFLLAAILLAQCRYESALYILPVALVVLYTWWKSRRIILSWEACMMPLFLIPVALHNKVLSHSPILWEMRENQTSRFSAEYLGGNLRSAVEFLFSVKPQHANSLLLGILGVAALFWGLTWFAFRRPSLVRMEPQWLVWFLFGFGVVTNTSLVMFYYWSAFTDPMAARFCLPFYLLLTFAAVIFSGWLARWWPAATSVLLVAVGAWFLGCSISKQAYHHYSRLGIDEIEWEKRFVAARSPGERLILTNKSTLSWLLQKTPAILLDRARLVQDRLHYQLGSPTFREILVIQSLRPTSVDGEHEIVFDERLPASYELELLAEKRFGTKIDRISRLVSVTPQSSVTANATTP